MSKERATLGFGAELDKADPTQWEMSPPASHKPRPEPEVTALVAREAGFRSREPRPAALPQSQRPGRGRPMTGRNVPLSLKVSEDCRALIDAAYEQLNEGQRVTLPMGEIVHRAFEALHRELEAEKEGNSKA